MTSESNENQRVANQEGEMASWLILAAALAIIAGTLAGPLSSVMETLACRIDSAASCGEIVVTTAPEPPSALVPAASPKPTAPELPDADSPEPELPPEPTPLSEELQAALDDMIGEIDERDDLGMSEGELDNVRDALKELSPGEVALIIAALSDEQLERLFHNVHASCRLCNDWNDRERSEFYGLLSGLPRDEQQRLSSHTDFFDLYDSELNPLDVRIDERDFVVNYQLITSLPLNEFLALRAHMWDHPELIAQSPFDWYADGCSIPGRRYPGALNAPCVLHDFAYTNAKVAAAQYGEEYHDVSAGGIAENWKQHADQRLARDIGDIPSWKCGIPCESAAGYVYAGVAVDWPGGHSGKETFEDDYRPHYGPGFDPNLGQWTEPSERMQSLVDLAIGAR